MAGLALGPARAAQGSPVDPVKAVYALLEAGTTGKHEVWFRPPHRDRLLTRRLAALFATDDRYMEESGDQGNLDFDPAANSQDPDVSNCLKPLPRRGAAERVQATFGANSHRMTVDFEIIREAGAWRIDDVQPHTDKQGTLSLRALLSQPYPCGSTTKTPCKR